MTVEELVAPDNAVEGQEVNYEDDADLSIQNQVTDIIMDSVYANIEETPSMVPLSNIQCGECGFICNASNELKSHIEEIHRRLNCEKCMNLKNSLSSKDQCLRNKDDIIEDLKKKNEHLMTKNVSLDKELKTIKLAFNESVYGKTEKEKEIVVLRDEIANYTRENSVLKDDLRVKEESIALMKFKMTENGRHATSENRKKEFICQDCDEVLETQDSLELHMFKEHKSSRANSNQRCMEVQDSLECKMCGELQRVECIEKHKIEKHNMCTICESMFRSKRSLDQHIDNKHLVQAKMFKCNNCGEKFENEEKMKDHIEDKHRKEFNCTNCPSRFSSEYHLKIHNERKHVNTTTIECNNCGEIFREKKTLDVHKTDCIKIQYEKKSSECYYYKRGRCTRGDSCNFSHRSVKQSVQQCRNGVNCGFHARGRCRFGHETISLRNRSPHRGNNYMEVNQVKWCRYPDDCWRLPNCTFLHYETDFPELPRRQNPPLFQRRHPQQGLRMKRH